MSIYSYTNMSPKQATWLNPPAHTPVRTSQATLTFIEVKQYVVN